VVRLSLIALIVVIVSSVWAQSGLILVEVEHGEDPSPRIMEEMERDGWDIVERGDHRSTAFVTPQQRALLEEQGCVFREIPIAPPTRAAVDGYLTFAEYEADMQSWALAHPGIVSLTSLGLSWEGRDIWMLKISDNVAVDEDEPEVLMLGLQHAREWLAGMTLHGITEHLITQYGSDAQVTALVDALEIHVVIVCNPDGYVYSHTTDRNWRHNRRPDGSVDLNRNWPYAWGVGVGGPSPLSEPETQALNGWLLTHAPEVVGCLNYHTYNTRVMHGWAHTYDLPPNADMMGPLAREVALAIESVNGQRMRNGSWAITLSYIGGGATNDHFQAAFGIPTLTLELRPGDGASGGFAPTGASIAPSVSENIEGALTFLEWARGQGEDATAPVISDVAVVGLSDTEATLTWTTDDPATRLVEFGTSTAYGTSEEPDLLRDLTHSVRLTGLTPGMGYHARAVSQNLAGLVTPSGDIPFTTFATPQDITPPSAPAIDTVRSPSSGVVEIAWIPLDGGPLAGHRLFESADGEVWTLLFDEGTLTAGMTSHTFTAPPWGQVRLYRLTNVDTAGNESAPSDVCGVMTRGAPAEVLIVDGYDQWNNKHIAQGGNHRFAGDHALAAAAHGTALDSCRNEMVGATVNLADYRIVIWVLGDESTANETFSDSEQDLVEAFLEGGGNLFVSGSEIGWDLDSQGDATDRAFYSTYLCADYVKDDIDDYDVDGSGGAGIFGTRTIRFDEGSRGIYRVVYPDGITPLNGAVAALESPQGEICAIQREGIFGSGISPGRIVHLGFPFETIFPASARAEVMADALTYFGATVPAELTGFSFH
jgi:Zinc carboxypeptidase